MEGNRADAISFFYQAVPPKKEAFSSACGALFLYLTTPPDSDHSSATQLHRALLCCTASALLGLLDPPIKCCLGNIAARIGTNAASQTNTAPLHSAIYLQLADRMLTDCMMAPDIYSALDHTPSGSIQTKLDAVRGMQRNILNSALSQQDLYGFVDVLVREHRITPSSPIAQIPPIAGDPDILDTLNSMTSLGKLILLCQLLSCDTLKKAT